MATAKKSGGKKPAAGKPRKHNVTYFSSGSGKGKKANPSKPRRKRNPFNTGIVAEGAKLAVSGAVIGFAQPWVRSIVGRFLPSGKIADAGVTLATSYGLAALAKFTPYTRNWERSIQLAGWSIVAAQVVSSFVVPWASQVANSLNLSGASGLGRMRRRGMGDLVSLPAGKYDPYFGSTPMIAAPAPVVAQPQAVGDKVATLKGLISLPSMPGVSRG
ncbi:MAG: hypothetical protein BWY07_01981 [Candidatus Hydrogenedentes bacterium ADurb.Bin170]|nr:MAG: hypothetical protein BWY07_01981 [Candidatus Hydrogenedentes bacterium ADurb.Bin170]